MLGETFDPDAEYFVHEHFRPHWSQAGAVVFITFRTRDSIPQEVIERWDNEKQDWMHRHGYRSNEHWSLIVESISDSHRTQFTKHFNRFREDFLDTCHGLCLLKNQESASIVAESLLHFDNDRYRMGDFVVMPNHVHLLAVFLNEKYMKDQCDSWLHFTAVQINKSHRQKGKFWQQEPFDHLVRSPEQYGYLRKYIEDNPRKARLNQGEYLYRRYHD